MMITCSVCGHLNDSSRAICEECGSGPHRLRAVGGCDAHPADDGRQRRHQRRQADEALPG